MPPPSTDSLAAQLRELRSAVARFSPDRTREGGWPEVDAVTGRLDRDLLPRTAGGHEHLVIGIVGPNNAGKSALFNALVQGAVARGEPAGPRISPSLPTGGATRRLVGALHPTLRAILEEEPTLRRFPMRAVSPGPAGVELATAAAEPGAESELLLVEDPSLSESLLLVDTPDFDSVLRENRAVTDALLAVADVAVVVVTRHTYQNHDAIEFLSGWLDHGRPWVLVYNESIDAATTRAHAAKITKDLGGAPEALFHAPFDASVGRGEAALVPLRIDGTGGEEGPSLAAWIRDLGARRDLKARALEASLAALRDELRTVGARARALSAQADEVLTAPRALASTLGRAVAREAMPMGPFLAAFRDVLDERPSAVQRELRRGLRWTGTQLTSGARWMSWKLLGRGGADPSDESQRTATLLDAERRELAARWTGFFEPALAGLRGELRAGSVDPRVRAALEPVTGGAPSVRGALERAEAALALDAELMAEYGVACREIITAELDRQGSEWFLQLAVDALHLAPLGLAGAIIVHTGGLGADMAVAGGGAVSAALAERLSRTLGTGVAMSARARWTELRSGRLAAAAMAGLLGDAEDALASLREEANAVGALSEHHLGAILWSTGARPRTP